MPLFDCPDTDAALRAEIQPALIARGLIRSDAEWVELTGGRSNAVWRIADPGGDLVCKVRRGARNSLLFPNDAEAEFTALQHLASSGLAPQAVTFFKAGTRFCLLYRHVAGEAGKATARETGKTLARLHSHAAPAGLRRPNNDPAAILHQADAMLADTPGRPRITRPQLPNDITQGPMVFLHGDPVPGNLVATPDGPVLIDWQCPAIGDPVHDLALALSPAMRRVAGLLPWSDTERDALLGAYAAPDTTARYRVMAPILSYRIAAHCLWRAARGDRDYADAVADEVRSVQGLGHQNHREHQPGPQ